MLLQNLSAQADRMGDHWERVCRGTLISIPHAEDTRGGHTEGQAAPLFVVELLHTRANLFRPKGSALKFTLPQRTFGAFDEIGFR